MPLKLDIELFRALNGYPGSIFITRVVPFPFTALVSILKRRARQIAIADPVFTFSHSRK